MDISKIFDRQKLMIIGILITVGVLGRIVLHDLFNSVMNPIETTGFAAPLDVFFIIATISLISGVLLGRYYTLIVPLCVIAITDIFYSIINPEYASYWLAYLFLFTWSGYGIIALLGSYTKQKTQLNKTFIPRILGAGILGIFLYDIWTNFGFWLGFSKLGFYPQTIEGLMTVYYGGLPTMLWHLLSTSIAITITATVFIYLKEHEFLKKDFTPKPMERYAIIGVTALLMFISILSAIL